MTLWVFGYGSLLWNPGFRPAEARRARLDGYRRSFCMLSIHHRGSEEDPGLVLALDAEPGQACTGMAFRVAEAEEEAVLATLRERELVSSAYLERRLPVQSDAGETIEALCYVIDPAHRQYCRLDLDTQARMIARAQGGRGPNTEYLYNTAAQMAELGVQDADMDWLVTRVRALAAT